MRDATTIVRERQREVRCAMDDADISLKAAARRADMSLSTFTSYFHGEKDREPAALSVPSLYKLIRGEALPLDLLSMLLPNGYQIVRVPVDVDHDTICAAINAYSAMKDRAHHPESEAGREIGPNEDAALRGQIVQIVGLAA